MSLRAQAAIVGIGELPTRRTYPGRTTVSLMAEAAHLALEDAGLRKEDLDGVVTNGETVNPLTFAEYIQVQPAFCEGATLHGASGAHSIAIAAAAITAGLAHTVLCVLGGTRAPDPAIPPASGARSVGSEWEAPYGPGAVATGRYALIKRRHMYEFGTTDEQFAKIAVDQRFNALKNPNAVFQGQPITIADVLNSRWVNEPLHLLECVMPCAGASAAIITSAERARSFRNRPVYVLGAGAGATTHDVLWQEPNVTTTPVAISARRAFEMAGYGPRDMQFAEFYD
jgi:acetyl-CoA acetyltransferase